MGQIIREVEKTFRARAYGGFTALNAKEKARGRHC